MSAYKHVVRLDDGCRALAEAYAGQAGERLSLTQATNALVRLGSGQPQPSSDAPVPAKEPPQPFAELSTEPLLTKKAERAVRRRMRRAGESYSTALSWLVAYAQARLDTLSRNQAKNKSKAKGKPKAGANTKTRTKEHPMAAKKKAAKKAAKKSPAKKAAKTVRAKKTKAPSAARVARKPRAKKAKAEPAQAEA